MPKYLLSRQILSSLTFFYLLILSPVFARQQLHGHVPNEANSSSYIGPMDTNQALNLAIGLPLQNQDELQQFLNDIYNPQSPLYHHFLSSAEFARRFGALDSDYQTVIDFAKAHNLTVTNTYPNHLLVDVQGSVSDIQKTFHVNLKRYQRPDGSEFHAPDQEPSVDLDVTLTHIGGLENHEIPKPSLSHFKKNEPNFLPRPNSGTGTQDGSVYPYFGSDFRNAYFPSCASIASYQGAGQTVALVEFDRFYASDISGYVSAASFVTNVTNQVIPISIDGFATTGAPVTADGNLEVSLDIEMVLCMAQSAQVYVYEMDPTAVTADDLYNTIASPPHGDPLCYQISSSWTGGLGDAGIQAAITEFAAQGQSYFQAAGDDGAYVGSNTVPDPIDITSEMTVVGGTELSTNGTHGTLGAYSGETTWNNPPNAGGGGICNSSTLVPIPTYQVPFVNSSNKASAVDRNIPDVSWTAYEIEVYAEGIGQDGWIEGTSAAAPLWAGFTTLINDAAAAASKSPVGFMNPTLYFLAQNFYNNDFNDITTGNNNASGSGLYPAATGYDLATGLGSPKCNLVADMINPPPINTPTITATPTITNTPTITPTPTNTPTPPTTNTSYAYPQPAHNGQVYIVYNSPIAQQVRINIYSLSGQQVDSVMDSPQASNQNRILISLQGFVPSVYYYIINGLSSGVLAKGKFLVVP